ncbi:MAG: glycerol-3-phosphate acyltransferase [Candidatus Saccharibacteria bacterium]
MFFLLCLLSYILGSIPFGKIVAHRHGIDIQKVGSGNIGFANVVRTLGFRIALPVLIGDSLKGFIPTYLALVYFGETGAMVVGAIAILAHIFPIWLRFRGGKGIATGLGVMVVMSPILIPSAIIAYLIGFAYFRDSGPGSLIAAWSLPIVCAFINIRLSLFYIVLALIISYAHRNNLRQLFSARRSQRPRI